MDLEAKIDAILNIVTSLKEDVAILKEDVAVLKEEVAALKEKVVALEEKVVALEEKVTTLEEKVAILRKDVDGLNRTVTLMENEHGEKIRALFDYMEVNKEEHKKLTELCLSIKSEIQGILFNHEKRIKNLENNLATNF